MQYFNIQVASQLSGVASATIRAWEKRYNAVVPERGDNKHRLYSEQDIEKLALLYRLTEVGQSIGKIAHLELEKLKQVYSSLMHRPYDELLVVTPHHEKINFDEILISFFIALRAYKLDIISHELEKATNILSPKDLCLKLLVPLFRGIRSKVEMGELTIAQEHILSAIFSFHAGQTIGQFYQKKHLKDDLILIATPAGEHDQICILGPALLCIHYGIKFIFLGTNLSSDSLSEAVNSLRPKSVLLGVKNQERLEDYLSDLSRLISGNTEVWVEGSMSINVKTELEKRKFPLFPTLEALDLHLQSL